MINRMCVLHNFVFIKKEVTFIFEYKYPDEESEHIHSNTYVCSKCKKEKYIEVKFKRGERGFLVFIRDPDYRLMEDGEYKR